MKTLTQILSEHNTDKNSYHTYGSIYEKLFEPIRFKIRNVLEIGVFEGESLRVWEEYFPYALINGFDKDLSLFKGNQFGISNMVFDHNSSSRIMLYQGDQSKEEDLSQVITRITKNYSLDIIIDDGSHNTYDQMVSFVTWVDYWSKNNANNFIYVIEDVPFHKAVRLSSTLGFKHYEGSHEIDDDNLLYLVMD